MAVSSTSFKPGADWRGNAAGRPKRETEREYLNVIIGLVSLETWANVVEKAIADALEGDKYAREWLSKYLLGEPEREPPGLDGDDDLDGENPDLG